MNKLRNPKIIGQLRHMLTMLGPVVMVIAAVDDPVLIFKAVIGNWDSLIGLLMAVVGFWMSWTAEEKAT